MGVALSVGAEVSVSVGAGRVAERVWVGDAVGVDVGVDVVWAGVSGVSLAVGEAKPIVSVAVGDALAVNVCSAVGDTVGSGVRLCVGGAVGGSDGVALEVATEGVLVIVGITSGVGLGVSLGVTVGISVPRIAALTSAAPIRPSPLKSTPMHGAVSPKVAVIAAATRSATGNSAHGTCARAKLVGTSATASEIAIRTNLLRTPIPPIGRALPPASINFLRSP